MKMKNNAKAEAKKAEARKAEELENEKIKLKISKMDDLEKSFLNESLLKLIESTEKTSDRRLLINSGFYLVILTTLLAGIFISGNLLIQSTISAIGIIMSIIWILNINYHGEINTAKFKTIELISEEIIGISVYHIEYGKMRKVRKITQYEKVIPVTFTTIFFYYILTTINNIFSIMKGGVKCQP